MSGQLKSFEHQNWHQGTNMQAVGRRIKTAIERNLPLCHQRIQRLRIRRLGNQTARLQILNQGGLKHRTTLHRSGRVFVARQQYKSCILSSGAEIRGASAKCMQKCQTTPLLQSVVAK